MQHMPCKGPGYKATTDHSFAIISSKFDDILIAGEKNRKNIGMEEIFHASVTQRSSYVVGGLNSMHLSLAHSVHWISHKAYAPWCFH